MQPQKTAVRIVDASHHRTPSMFLHSREGWAVTIRFIGGVMASYLRRVQHERMDRDRAERILFRYISKARAAGMDLDLCHLPHLEKIQDGEGTKLEPRAAIPITWRQCDPSCPGWAHMDSGAHGATIEACDECERFTRWDRAAELNAHGQPVAGYVTRDDLALEAHDRECGCRWVRFHADQAQFDTDAARMEKNRARFIASQHGEEID